jgi:hypothetical protein
MSVTLKGTIHVDHHDLRPAFASVRPHSAPGKRGDDVLPLHRVRLVAAHRFLYVLACNGSTMACARVQIFSDTRPSPEELDDGPFVVDLPPADVDDFVRLFKLKRLPADAPAEQGRIALTFTEHEVSFEEGPGGLWGGKTFGIPIAEPAEQFPDVRGALGRAVRAIGETTARKPLVASSGVFGMFRAATAQYKEPGWVWGAGDTSSPTYVVTVGPQFVASFGSGGQDPDHAKRNAAVIRTWIDDLPDRRRDLAAVDPVAEAERELGGGASLLDDDTDGDD